MRRTPDGGCKQHLQCSPHGKRLAFVSNRDGGHDVYVMGVP